VGILDWLIGRSRRKPAAPVTVHHAPTEADILASLTRVEAMLADGTAPSVVRSRVARVDRTIRETLPKLPQLGWGSSDAYAVVATATDYLPEAVGGYLRLPRDWADSRPIEGGRTALMVLVDQLELLASTMSKMLDAANRADAEALIAHGRFLEAKFGRSSSGGVLDADPGSLPDRPPGPSSVVPPTPPAPPPPPRSTLDLE
jgi:hypothetical protein